MYEIIDLEQGSQKWHQFRSNHIGGSDAPIIMGLSPWSNPYDLWCFKMGFKEPQPMTDRMKRGQDLEPEVRSWYENKTEDKFDPIVLESKIHPFMSASLDGLSYDNPRCMIEIKCPNEDTHELACAGIIKDYYMCQIQHCLFVSNCEVCVYISYRPGGTQTYTDINIFRNEKMIKKIIQEENKFWDCMTNMTEPETPWFLKKPTNSLKEP